jgi:hypothetical protein
LQHSTSERTLRKVPQYRKASITHEVVDPRELCWLTTALEPFKLTRVEFLVTLLDEMAIEKFRSLWIEGTPRIITAPIVEEGSDGKRILIDGHHRMYYCVENEINQVSVIVIRGVKDPLPASIVGSWEHLTILPHRLSRSERYKNYKSQHFRPIGEAFESLGVECFNKGGIPSL